MDEEELAKWNELLDPIVAAYGDADQLHGRAEEARYMLRWGRLNRENYEKAMRKIRSDRAKKGRAMRTMLKEFEEWQKQRSTEA